MVKKQNDFSAIQEEKPSFNNFSMKKIQKSPFDLEEMDSIFKGKDRKWTDPDFPYQNFKVGSNQVEWKRPEEII